MGKRNVREERIPWYHWYEEPACLAELVRWLDERGEAPQTVDEFVYFLEAPWKWQPDWDAMNSDEEHMA